MTFKEILAEVKTETPKKSSPSLCEEHESFPGLSSTECKGVERYSQLLTALQRLGWQEGESTEGSVKLHWSVLLEFSRNIHKPHRTGMRKFTPGQISHQSKVFGFRVYDILNNLYHQETRSYVYMARVSYCIPKYFKKLAPILNSQKLIRLKDSWFASEYRLIVEREEKDGEKTFIPDPTIIGYISESPESNDTVIINQNILLPDIIDTPLMELNSNINTENQELKAIEPVSKSVKTIEEEQADKVFDYLSKNQIEKFDNLEVWNTVVRNISRSRGIKMLVVIQILLTMGFQKPESTEALIVIPRSSDNLVVISSEENPIMDSKKETQTLMTKKIFLVINKGKYCAFQDEKLAKAVAHGSGADVQELLIRQESLEDFMQWT